MYSSDFKNINLRYEDEKKRKNKGQHVFGKSRIRWNICDLFRYFCELLDEYCEYSSLHGLRYIRDKSIPRIERFFWLGIFLTCLYISGIVVKNTYLAGMTHEYQLEYDPKRTPIWKIPFPSVVVCSSIPVRKSVFDLEKRGQDPKFRHFSKLLCPNKIFFKSEVFNDTIDDEFFEFINNVAVKCEDFITNCYWGANRRNCCTLLKPVITQFGLCYSFNKLPGEVMYKYYSPPTGFRPKYDDDVLFWDVDNGYPELHQNQPKVRPRWSNVAGALFGLTIDLIDLSDERQTACTGSQSGFRVYIFSPDMSFETEAYFRVPENVHTFVKLDPQIIQAEPTLRSVDTDVRKCLFADEVQLEYFNYYTTSSCYVECYTKLSLLVCGCVPFTSRRLLGEFGYPYCNDSSTSCMENLLSDKILELFLKPGKGMTDPLIKCECPSGCSQMSYDFQTSFQKLLPQDPFASFTELKSTLKNNVARLTIYFGNDDISTIRRKQTSTLGGTIANCGGLLGLLLGFSFISFFELIYYVVIRPTRKVFTSFIVYIYEKYYIGN